MKSSLRIALLLPTSLSVLCIGVILSSSDIRAQRFIAAAHTRKRLVHRINRIAGPNPSQTSTSQTKTVADPEIRKLLGNWQVVSWADETGEQVPPEELKHFKFLFDGDRLTMRKFQDDQGTQCQFRIDATKEPKWIDLGMPTLTEGSTILEGIYNLAGDDLNLCFTSGLVNGVAPPRPSEFKTKPNQKYAVLLLKRLP